jgi:hypothetical protein
LQHCLRLWRCAHPPPSCMLAKQRHSYALSARWAIESAASGCSSQHCSAAACSKHRQGLQRSGPCVKCGR